MHFWPIEFIIKISLKKVITRIINQHGPKQSMKLSVLAAKNYTWICPCHSYYLWNRDNEDKIFKIFLQLDTNCLKTHNWIWLCHGSKEKTIKYLGSLPYNLLSVGYKLVKLLRLCSTCPLLQAKLDS